MSDITALKERLRKVGGKPFQPWELCLEAAAAIEALERERDDVRAAFDLSIKTGEEQYADAVIYAENLKESLLAMKDVMTQAAAHKHRPDASADYRYGWMDAVTTIMGWGAASLAKINGPVSDAFGSNLGASRNVGGLEPDAPGRHLAAEGENNGPVEFHVWEQRGEEVEFVAQVNGPREMALADAQHYAMQSVADGAVAFIEEVTRREVERRSAVNVEYPSEPKA